jgi:hypothetical protein
MDCQNLANVLSGIRDMDALCDSSGGDWTVISAALSPAAVSSLLEAVGRKLSTPSGDAESRVNIMDNRDDHFSVDGLVALCLSLCYIDRNIGSQLSRDSSSLLLKGIVRAISSSCSSGTLTPSQAAPLLRGLEELGWLKFLSPKNQATLLLHRTRTAGFDS